MREDVQTRLAQTLSARASPIADCREVGLKGMRPKKQNVV